MRKVFICIFIILMMISITSFSYAQCASSRPDVQHFIERMVKRYHFSRKELYRLFCHVSVNDEVITRINKPYEEKPWYLYRDFFITPDRIKKGVAYWNTHDQTLQLAEKKYGVPASIIVAIIGVETKYGENKGKFQVLNSLTTLSFNNRRRCHYFRGELAQFLLLAREHRFDPLTLKGSYAGALGLPQFMPSSYRRYAVDFHHKGRSDLINNHEDAIASVANYLQKHGWTTGRRVVIPAVLVDSDDDPDSYHKNLKPTLNKSQLAYYGIKPLQPIDGAEKMIYIKLQGQNEQEHWLGLHNFYVISTYNMSKHYVMVVNLLAQKIRDLKYGHKSETPPKVVQQKRPPPPKEIYYVF